MKVEVESIRDGVPGERSVLLRCRTGSIEGRARTHQKALQVGRSYDLEMTVNYPLLFDENVCFTSEREYRTTVDDGTNTFVGEVDDVDPDGLVYFRLGMDSLSMMAIDPPPRPGEWLRIMIPSKELELYFLG